MVRQAQQQEQTGPINPQMPYVEEQQFISQETAKKTTQAANEYQTIFGSDAPTAFKPTSTPAADLYNIALGTERVITESGRTLDIDVNIDRQNDAIMVSEINNQIRIINSDPSLTPEQKKLAILDLETKASQSALRPETKEYFDASTKVTMNNVEFLTTEENFENSLLALKKDILKMSSTERLEKGPLMFRVLKEKYPAFSLRVEKEAREADLKSYELVFKEKVSKSVIFFNTAIDEFLSAPSIQQDRNKIYSLSPEALYNAAIGIMGENEEAKNFIPTNEDLDIRNVLMNKANTVLFELQGEARNSERRAKTANFGRIISNSSPGSHNGIVAAMDEGGLAIIGEIGSSPVLMGESEQGYSFGVNLNLYKQDLMRVDPKNPEFLMHFFNIAQWNKPGLELTNPEQYNIIKEAMDIHSQLKESEEQPTTEEISALKFAAGLMLDDEVNSLILRLAGVEDAQGTFGYQAILGYTQDLPSRIEEDVRSKDNNNTALKNTRNTSGEQTFKDVPTGTDVWVPYSNALLEGIQGAVNSLDLFYAQFTLWPKRNQSEVNGIPDDIFNLTSAANELQEIRKKEKVFRENPRINKRKNKLVNDVFKTLEKYDLNIATPKINASPDMDTLTEANDFVRGTNTRESAMYLAPIALNKYGNVTGKDLEGLRTQFRTSHDNLREALEENKEFIPSQIYNELIDGLDIYQKEILDNPKSTGEDIIRGGLGTWSFFEEKFQKPPKDNLHQMNTWGILQGVIKENKQNVINHLKSEDSKTTREFDATPSSDGDGNFWSIRPRVGSARQFARLLEGYILPLVERGNVSVDGSSIRYLVDSINGIGSDFNDAMKGEENPENKLAAGLAAISSDTDHTDILRTLLDIYIDPDRNHLLPTPLVNAMRENFMVPVLGEGNKRVLASLVSQKDTVPEYAATVDLLDTALPVLLNTKNPKYAVEMARVLNIATSRLNQAGTYRYSHTDIEISNTDLLFSGLEEAVPQYRAGIVDPKGRSSFLTGVTPSQANAISLTGLPFDSSLEAVEDLGEARHISEALLGAMFDAIPEVRQPQAIYGWMETIFNESMRSFTDTDPEATLPVEGSEKRALIAKGRLLGLSMSSNSTMALSIVPSGNINTESSLKWHPATPDKPGFYSIDGVEVETANELLPALEKDFASANPAFKIEAHYVTSPNNISPVAEGVKPTVRFVPQRDMGSKVATGMPAGQQRRVEAFSQVTVANTASGAAIRSFITSDLSGFRQLNAHLGVEEGIHPELQPGFEALLGSFDTSVGNSESLNGTVDQNLRQWPEKVDSEGKEIFLSTQDYGRSVADQEALLQGLGILHFQIRETLEQNPDMTPEQLTETVNRQMIELSQMLDTSKGISTWETTDDIMFERPSGDGTTTQIDQYEIDIEFMDMMRGASYSNHNRDFLSSYSLAPGQDYNAWAKTWTGTRWNYRQDNKLYRTDRRLLPKSIRDTMGSKLKEDFSWAGGKQMRLEYYWRRPLTPLQSYQNMGSR